MARVLLPRKTLHTHGLESCFTDDMESGHAPRFDAEFFELPDGTITIVVRHHWPSADDVVEVLGRSYRRGPKRVQPESEVSRTPNTTTLERGIRPARPANT